MKTIETLKNIRPIFKGFFTAVMIIVMVQTGLLGLEYLLNYLGILDSIPVLPWSKS